MPGQVRPRESCTTGGSHAGDHVGVGDDQARVGHEAGSGGGVAALLCGSQDFHDGGAGGVKRIGLNALGRGGCFGGDELADLGNGGGGGTLLRTESIWS